jgi:hypothetical protein
MFVIKMNKLIAIILFLIITITLINPINVKASDSDDIVYEVVKNRNPDLIITGCNETYVYWEFNYRKFDPPVAIRGPGLNESTYIDKIPGDYDSEKIFIYDMLTAKYNLHHSNWYQYYEFIASIRQELEPLQDKIFKEKGELGINWIGVWNTVPPAIIVTMYKITDEKVNIVLEYLKPYAKKYNAVVFFIEDYFPASIYKKQDEVLYKAYREIDKWYIELLKEYYGVTMEIEGFKFAPGIAELPIPKNATFNEEFVRKVVSTLREYTGCEVPLVVDFEYYTGLRFLAYTPPYIHEPSGMSLKTFSLGELLILFVIIPITIFASLAILSRKKHKKK